jgi:hypothetical protein
MSVPAVVGEEFSFFFPDEFGGKKMVHFPDGRWKGARRRGCPFFRYREGYGCVCRCRGDKCRI